MNKLSKEKRDLIILVFLGAAIVLAGIWFGLIDGQLKNLKVKRAQKVEKEDKVATAERLLKQADRHKADRLAAEKLLASYEEQMASGDFYTWSFRLMEQFMATNHVKLLDASRPANAELGMFAEFPYEAIKFTVRSAAYYHDFGVFLQAFENSHRHMRIQNITMDPTAISAEEAPEKLLIQFEVVALVRPTEKKTL